MGVLAAGCSAAPEHRQAGHGGPVHGGPVHVGPVSGQPVLRALYRDTGHRLLVVLPDARHRVPRGDCAAPLLIDEASGRARQVTANEAAALAQHMELVGAVEGTCP
ncbi:hypothetical protein Y88_2651 [Novosphingobium nitrogenifigens DSM 19370]|uniref:Uncharacterized protein n=1 Tax=Novosphingobium nitrogenifigens DSM 19370 TaxID=983920 RepID=F1Z703_9SPHN|nr:hypothetical protein Y88_2651 [Novosphingobium nitrogenifigens DSM 19370]